MKKIIIICLLLIIIGCTKENEVVVKDNSEELKEKLIEYGKLIYENDTWINGGIQKGIYTMTLNEMSERNKYDISMFINSKTNVECNREKTRIEFIVFEEVTPGTTNYIFNPVLDCN